MEVRAQNRLRPNGEMLVNAAPYPETRLDYHGNALNLNPFAVTWPRVLDLNDRALRDVIVGLGGKPNGYPRESGFDIAVASEVMAVANASSMSVSPPG